MRVFRGLYRDSTSCMRSSFGFPDGANRYVPHGSAATIVLGVSFRSLTSVVNARLAVRASLALTL